MNPYEPPKSQVEDVVAQAPRNLRRAFPLYAIATTISALVLLDSISSVTRWQLNGWVAALAVVGSAICAYDTRTLLRVSQAPRPIAIEAATWLYLLLCIGALLIGRLDWWCWLWGAMLASLIAVTTAIVYVERRRGVRVFWTMRRYFFQPDKSQS